MIVQIMIDVEKARQAVNEIKARHRDITQLEASIRELRDMFTELAHLVSTQVQILSSFHNSSIECVFSFQGEMIDNIEYNVSKATELVDNARTDLEKTVADNAAARKVREIFLAKQSSLLIDLFF